MAPCYIDSPVSDGPVKQQGAIMRMRFRSEDGVGDMGLKAPGIITFMLSVILTVIVLTSKFFGADIPGLTGNESWALLVSYSILMLGCMVRGM
jgi:hypothetical protein